MVVSNRTFAVTAVIIKTEVFSLINTYSMKQPDLYYFETIKMTSQALSNFVWRILVNFD